MRDHTPGYVRSGATQRAWLLLLVVAMLALAGMQPGEASAHASLTGTDPADGAVLDAAPERVTLSFSEPVDLVEEGYRLFDDEGLIGTLEAETAGPDVLLTLPDDPGDGSYVVAWRVISADGHPISGVLLFSLGEAGGARVAVPDEANITPVVSVVQGIAYMGLLAAVGLLLFRVLVTGDVRVDRIPALVAAVIAVIGHVLLIPLAALRGAGRPLGDVFQADAWNGGTDDLTVIVALIVAVALAGAFIATYARSGTQRLAGVLTGSLGTLVTLPMVGHTRTDGFSAMLSGIDLVHGLAGAVWFGGLIGLARYLRREGSRDPLMAVRVVSRFSTLAGIVFAIAAASGVYLAFQYLDSLDALVDTTYGRLLIAKILVLLVPFGLAAWNRFSLIPTVAREPDTSATWHRLRRVVIAEVLLLIAVVGLTGFLVLQSPQGEPVAAESGIAATPYEETVEFNGGTLDVRLTPGAAGTNELTVDVRGEDGSPVVLENPPGVTLSLPEQGLGPISESLEETETPGVYAGEVQIPLRGEWEILIGMRLSRFEQATVTVTVDIP